MKWFKKNYKKLIISVLGLALVAFIVIGIPMTKSTYAYQATQEFNKEDFTDANTLNNKEKLVASNGNYELIFDEVTSHFKVRDRKTSYIWYSNPVEQDTFPGITNSALERQKATVELSYVNDAGTTTSINNYRRSIAHPKGIINAEGEKTFSINYTNNSVQVLYNLVDLEIDFLYFPKYISVERMEEFGADAYELESYAYTSFNNELNAYEIKNYDATMSNNVKTRLYNILYNKHGYTLEQTQEENASFGYFGENAKVEFQVGIEIKLIETGVEIKLIRNSIVENGATLIEATMYPYFGTAVSQQNGLPTNGYIVLPDGSGSVIDFNNGKTTQNVYKKRLYGNDMAIMPMSQPEQQQKISIPLYGMIKENNGYAAIITQGDAMASISADISGRVDSYNKVYTSFNLREIEQVTLGTGFNRYAVRLWTKDIVSTDFAVQFNFLKDEMNSYAGVANVYKNHLMTQLNMSKNDVTNKTQVTTEFIGAYDKKSFFLGVPYMTLESLTTFDQAAMIIEELKERQINNINVSYLGVANGGLINHMYDSNEVAKVLGGKEGLQNLQTYLNSNNIDLYQDVNFATTKSYRGFTDSFKYNSLRVQGTSSMYFAYDYPTRLPSSESQTADTTDQYVINPLYYQALYDAYNKEAIASGVSLKHIGTLLAGNYDYDNTLYRQDAVNIQKSLMESIEQNILLSNPNAYAFSYASMINNIPTETTLYSIVDYQIPLVQLVLSGLVDYTSDSLNITSDRNVQYQFLKSLETGSNLKYTLSYDDSQELLQTQHNQYMSTHYVNWLDQIESQVKLMDNLKIHEGYLTNHTKVLNNVYEVTYSNGLKLVINYNFYDVKVGTTLVKALDYAVLQEGK